MHSRHNPHTPRPPHRLANHPLTLATQPRLGAPPDLAHVGEEAVEEDRVEDLVLRRDVEVRDHVCEEGGGGGGPEAGRFGASGALWG